MPALSLDALEPHPDNANRMPRDLMDKLASHIRETGEYPPLIVRPHPVAADRFQILDGHHRAQVLRELGHEHARCEIWHVDDARASLLLLTLNRLHGEDDPQRRGNLLAKLRQSMSIEQLARMLPDDAARIEKLIALTAPLPSLAAPPSLPDMPQAVTFFLPMAQRQRLERKLRSIDRDRNRALIIALDLKEPACSK